MSSTGRPHRSVFPALTGVRFPLALWVVSYHLSGHGHFWERLAAYPPVATILSHAYISLGTFFAISGFLLTQAHSVRRWTRAETGRYFAARFARIYPLYALSLLILAPIIAENWHGTGVFLRYVFVLQGWTAQVVNWNTPAWSLSCEVLFYACFPLLVLMLRHGTAKSVLFVTGLAFAIPIVVFEAGVPSTCKPLIYAGDFLIGMAASAIYDAISRLRSPWLKRGPWLHTPALIVAVLLVIFGEQIHPWLLFDESMRLANGTLLLGLALGGGWMSTLLSSRLFLAGGLASYAIYILHVPILWWFSRFAVFKQMPPILAGAAYVLLVFAVALLASRFVEFPANRLLREMAERRIARGLPLRRPGRAGSEIVLLVPGATASVGLHKDGKHSS